VTKSQLIYPTDLDDVEVSSPPVGEPSGLAAQARFSGLNAPSAFLRVVY